jgi:D-glycero-D-manno-heptose 1,7-bisphosphate phosphatase
MILPSPIIHPVPYTVLIFDADGTLRGCTVPGRPPNNVDESVLLPGVEVLLEAPYTWQQRHLFGIASNQGGVGLGYMPETVCRNMLDTLAWQITHHYWPDPAIRYCPHAPRAGCACRKPEPAMLLAIEMFWHSQGRVHGPGECLYIGDQDSDREAAERAGFDFCWSADFFGWTTP